MPPTLSSSSALMSEPFASTQEFGYFIQSTIADTDPAALMYLEAASDVVRDYLQQQIDMTVNDVIVVRPESNGNVFLPELPVVSVSLVESYLGGVWTPVVSTSYQVVSGTGVLTLDLSALAAYGLGVADGLCRVTYTHGYQDTPNSIKQATLGVAARAWSVPIGVETERIGGYQVKYAVQATGFSPIELAALNRYRVPRVA